MNNFNRFQEQCKKCGCWCENIFNTGDKEAIDVMRKHDIECSQEQEIWTSTTPCNCFLNIEEKS